MLLLFIIWYLHDDEERLYYGHEHVKAPVDSERVLILFSNNCVYSWARAKLASTICFCLLSFSFSQAETLLLLFVIVYLLFCYLFYYSPGSSSYYLNTWGRADRQNEGRDWGLPIKWIYVRATPNPTTNPAIIDRSLYPPIDPQPTNIHTEVFKKVGQLSIFSINLY